MCLVTQTTILIDWLIGTSCYSAEVGQNYAEKKVESVQDQQKVMTGLMWLTWCDTLMFVCCKATVTHVMFQNSVLDVCCSASSACPMSMKETFGW